ncbi:hypothetical protein SteCoe_13167 [Stentor coeruleus]|uniref:Uncharacterized protein n=1 Tax=Stentor coeruleus TaxID=5963 RepID=A0A1R2C917_9CILI|nr:hypothetical protein SteCoe_13167 [Stentor coeruleus]
MSLLKSESIIKTTFSQYFKDLCQAYGNNKIYPLRDMIEPGLKEKIELGLLELNNSGFFFKMLDYQEPKVELYDFKLHFGVEFERKKNFKKKNYMFIGKASSDESLINMEKLKEKIEESGIDEDEWRKEIELMDLYVNGNAPLNLMMSVIAKLESLNPLILTQNNKEIQNEDRYQETHLIQFEAEIFRTTTQFEGILRGDLESIMKIATEKEDAFLEKQWMISDIDNIMNGNPYVLD